MYIIYKTVGAFKYYLQEYKGVRQWNGLHNNAKKFTEERLAKSFLMAY